MILSRSLRGKKYLHLSLSNHCGVSRPHVSGSSGDAAPAPARRGPGPPATGRGRAAAGPSRRPRGRRGSCRRPRRAAPHGPPPRGAAATTFRGLGRGGVQHRVLRLRERRLDGQRAQKLSEGRGVAGSDARRVYPARGGNDGERAGKRVVSAVGKQQKCRCGEGGAEGTGGRGTHFAAFLGRAHGSG